MARQSDSRDGTAAFRRSAKRDLSGYFFSLDGGTRFFKRK